MAPSFAAPAKRRSTLIALSITALGLSAVSVILALRAHAQTQLSLQFLTEKPTVVASQMQPTTTAVTTVVPTQEGLTSDPLFIEQIEIVDSEEEAVEVAVTRGVTTEQLQASVEERRAKRIANLEVVQEKPEGIVAGTQEGEEFVSGAGTVWNAEGLGSSRNMILALEDGIPVWVDAATFFAQNAPRTRGSGGGSSRPHPSTNRDGGGGSVVKNVLTVDALHVVNNGPSTMTGDLFIGTDLDVGRGIRGAVIRSTGTSFTNYFLGKTGFGTTSPETQIEVVGTASGTAIHGTDSVTSSGTLTVDGDSILRRNVTVGTTSSDLFTIHSKVSGSLIPVTTNTYDLGSSGMRWRDLYLSGSSIHIGADGDEATFGYNETLDYIYFDPNGTSVPTAVITDSGRVGIGTNAPTQELDVIGTIRASQTLASSGTLVVEGNTTLGTNDMNTISASGRFITDLIPMRNDEKTLGISTRRWQELFVGPSSIDIGTDGNSAKINYDTASDLLGFDPDGDTTNEVVILDNGNVGIGNTAPDHALDVTGTIHATVTLASSGTLVAEGETSLNGDINLGDSDTDDIEFNGEVDSHILPDDNNEYDLGSATKRWRDIYGNLNPGFLPGSIVFISATGSLAQDNSDFFWDEDANELGIGTNTPSHAVDVVGTIHATDTLASSGTLVVAGETSLNGDINLGDGITDTVLVNARVGSNMIPDTSSTRDLGSTAFRWGDFYMGDDDFFHLGTTRMHHDSTDNRLEIDSDTDGLADVFITEDGDVGIGTISISPDRRLTVGGTVHATLTLASSGTLVAEGNTALNGNIDLGDSIMDTITFTGVVDSDIVPDTDDMRDLGSTTARWQDVYVGPGSLDIGTNGNSAKIEYDTTSNRIELDADSDGTAEFVVTDDGEIGIGNESPDHALDVTGTAHATVTLASSGTLVVEGATTMHSTLTLSALTAGSVVFGGTNGVLSQDNSNFFWDSANGRLGIGNNSPDVALEVTGQVRGSSFSVADGTEGSPAMRFTNDADTGIFSAAADTIAFATGGVEAVRIDSNGDVEIGAPDAAGRLRIDAEDADDVVVLAVDSEETTGTQAIIEAYSDVGSDENLVFKVTAAGDVTADGTFTGGGADYAEYFYTSDADLVSGELVSIDLSAENTVRRARSARDTNVMGIVSSIEQAAFIGDRFAGNRPSNTVLVGLIGQLKTKISSENGVIRPGDALTTSSIPGVAMRADAGDPTVGIALEGGSTGEINVLVARKNSSLTVDQVGEEVTRRVADMQIEDEVEILIASALEELGISDTVESEVQEQIAALDVASQIDEAFVTKLSGIVSFENDTPLLSVASVAAFGEATVFQKIVRFEDAIQVAGQATLGSLIVNEETTFKGDVVAEGDVRVAGTVAGSTVSIEEDASVGGDLTVGGTLILNGEEFDPEALEFDLEDALEIEELLVAGALVAEGSVTIEGTARLLGSARFEGDIIINSRYAGQATIEAEKDRVQVRIDPPYPSVPYVTVTPVDWVYSQYRVTEKSTGGFVIELMNRTVSTVTFDWHASVTEQSAQQVAVQVAAQPQRATEPDEQDDRPVLYVTDLNQPLIDDPVLQACIWAGNVFGCERSSAGTNRWVLEPHGLTITFNPAHNYLDAPDHQIVVREESEENSENESTSSDVQPEGEEESSEEEVVEEEAEEAQEAEETSTDESESTDSQSEGEEGAEENSENESTSSDVQPEGEEESSEEDAEEELVEEEAEEAQESEESSTTESGSTDPQPEGEDNAVNESTSSDVQPEEEEIEEVEEEDEDEVEGEEEDEQGDIGGDSSPQEEGESEGEEVSSDEDEEVVEEDVEGEDEDEGEVEDEVEENAEDEQEDVGEDSSPQAEDESDENDNANENEGVEETSDETEE